MVLCNVYINVCFVQCPDVCYVHWTVVFWPWPENIAAVCCQEMSLNCIKVHWISVHFFCNLIHCTDINSIPLNYTVLYQRLLHCTQQCISMNSTAMHVTVFQDFVLMCRIQARKHLEQDSVGCDLDFYLEKPGRAVRPSYIGVRLS